MRGCFPLLPEVELEPLLIPAHAGVFLRPDIYDRPETSDPRSCGGVSLLALVAKYGTI